MDRRAYELTARHEEGHWWFRARRRLVLAEARRAARELGAPARRLRILDYGCGTGFNLRFLGALGEAVGADVAGEARELWKAHGHAFLDLRGDLRAERGRYHLVTALDVIEHFEDDVEGLSRIVDLLAEGGQVLVTVPAYRWLWSGEDVLSEHKRRYTARSLLGACARAGLRPIFATYFNLSILPGLAARVLGERIVRREGPPRSHLAEVPRWLDRLLYALASGEAALLGTGRLRLPAGASVLARLARSNGKGAA